MGSTSTPEMIAVEALSKTFVLHTQGGASIAVLHEVGLSVRAGECVALFGQSGVGKSTLLRALYGNYKAQGGRILVRHDGHAVDMTAAPPRQILAVRRRTVGYVSQFLRVVPRVPAREIVAEPLVAAGAERPFALERAEALLARLNLPQRLRSLAPATFSGGEQQRINIARGFVVDYPILLLDEPTAALDAANRAAVVDLINEAKGRGAAIVGIFHDHEVRTAVADRLFALGSAAEAA